MIGKLFLPPNIGHAKNPGTINNCDVPGTHHFHMRYGGSGPPSLGWTELFGYGGMNLDPITTSRWDDTNVAELKNEFYMVSHAGPTEPFWAELYKGAFFGAKKQEAKLKILYPRILGDYASQLKIIERLIDQNPLAIATTMPDPTSFLPVLRRAQDAGIPIVLFSTKNIRKGKLTKLPFPSIGIDDYRAAQTLALQSLKSKRIHSRVVVLMHLKGPNGFEQRLNGIKSVFDSQQDIIVDQLLIRTDMEDSHLKFRRYLEDHPDCSAIFCLRASILSCIKNYLVDFPKLFKRDPLFLTCFDKTPLAVSLLERGLLKICVDTRPFLQGFLSINVPPKNYRLNPVFLTNNKKKRTKKETSQNQE